MGQIAAMQCSECGVDFAPNEGGLCAVCRRPFCMRHLVTGAAGESYYCRTCLPAGEPVPVARHHPATAAALALRSRALKLLARAGRTR
jgi:hypothetical protein